MKIPSIAPTFLEIYSKLPPESLARALRPGVPDDYRHWDELKHRSPPNGLSRDEWWCALKLQRFATKKQIPLFGPDGEPFSFSVPDTIGRQLHEIDLGAGGRIGIPELVANADQRDQYLIRSLMEEAITSSQLEGAVTTREVAKEMLRSGRSPRDKSEKMILNNYRTMRRIRDLKQAPLTPELVFELHRMVTEDTLDIPGAAGRFRTPEELITIEDDAGEIMHLPPKATQLPARMEAMCSFANSDSIEPFVHPVIRAMILHFWLAYDHPFVDGNGRTARALFYHSMLRADYWLFEFISISDILKRAPTKYYRAFLYSETDENDLTYFLLHQSDVIRKAIASLHEHIAKKSIEIRDTRHFLKNWRHLNPRQQALLAHALRHPGFAYTIEGHQTSHDTSYNTARTDLLALAEEQLLDLHKQGRKMIFFPTESLETTIKSGGHSTS